MELRKIIKDRTNGQINDFIKLEENLIFEEVWKKDNWQIFVRWCESEFD